MSYNNTKVRRKTKRFRETHSIANFSAKLLNNEGEACRNLMKDACIPLFLSLKLVDYFQRQKIEMNGVEGEHFLKLIFIIQTDSDSKNNAADNRRTEIQLPRDRERGRGNSVGGC